MSNIISKAQILKFGKKSPESRAINALDGMEVFIKHLSSAEKYEWELSALDDEGKLDKNLLPKTSFNFVAKCVLDEKLQPFFTASEVAELDADLVLELREACQEVNSIKPKAVSEAGKS